MEINAETKLKQIIYTDLFDELLSLRLRETISMLCEELDKRKAKGTLEPHQQEDWDQLLEDLYCVESAYVYYSGDYGYEPRLEEYETDED